MLRAARRYRRELAAGRVLSGLSRIELTPEVVERAARVEPVSLSSLDAVHLASALVLADELDGFVTYDRRLAAAAEAAGLRSLSPS